MTWEGKGPGPDWTGVRGPGDQSAGNRAGKRVGFPPGLGLVAGGGRCCF